MTGAAPLRVQFSATGLDPQGGELIYEWDFDDRGGSFNQSPQYTYTEPGTYTATLTVTDPQGKTGTDTVEVVVTEERQPGAGDGAAADPASGPGPLAVEFSAQATDADGPRPTCSTCGTSATGARMRSAAPPRTPTSSPAPTGRG